MDNSTENLSATISAFTKQLANPDQIPLLERLKLLSAIEELRDVIEPPLTSLQRLMTGAHPLVATKIAIGMGLFDALASLGGEPLTLGQLHSKTKGDENLLRRIIRILSTSGVVKETAQDQFQPSGLAMMLVSASPAPAAITHFYGYLKGESNLYEYFESTGYREPDDAYDGPWQFGDSTKQHYFDWLKSNTEQLQAFNTVMEMASQGAIGQQWYKVYPASENLQTAADRVCLVDIGGGTGHDLVNFRKSTSEVKGTLVLQDLPQVIDDIKEPLPDGIEAMKFDMFSPQPLKGAKAYYLRHVLHNWPDKQAKLVLKNVKEAMDKNSILLVNETVMPEFAAPSMVASTDLSLMLLYSALERTEKQWVALLESSGFKLIKIWKLAAELTSAMPPTSLFEAVLK